MKPTHNFNSKMKSAIAAISLIIASSLFLTSCKKEELQQVSSSNSAYENSSGSRTGDQLPVLSDVFATIKIDRFPANTMMADYSITVNADGTAPYEGRRNVKIAKTITLELTYDQLKGIINTCKEINFFQIKGIAINIPDVPVVTTTYKTLDKSKTLSDSEGLPSNLVAFRMEIEYILNIAKFVKSDRVAFSTFDSKN